MNVMITSVKCLLVAQNSAERRIATGSPCTVLVLSVETFVALQNQIIFAYPCFCCLGVCS